MAKNLTKHDFFKEINSELKAYLLGWMYGDGSISKRKRSENCTEKTVTLSLSERDEMICELFRKNITPHKKLLNRKGQDLHQNGKIYKCKPQVAFSANSKQLCDDLEKLGCLYNKTKLQLSIPKIPKKLIIHFIRGVFDADGTCQVDIVKRLNRPIGSSIKRTFHIVMYTNQFLEEIRDFLNLNFDMNTKVYISKQKYFQLKLTNIKDLQKLYHLFYDNSEFFLERKKVRFFEASMLTPSKIREIKSLNLRNA